MFFHADSHFSSNHNDWRVNLNHLKIRKGTVRGTIPLDSDFRLLSDPVLNFSRIKYVIFFYVKEYGTSNEEIFTYFYQTTEANSEGFGGIKISTYGREGLNDYINKIVNEKWDYLKATAL